MLQSLLQLDGELLLWIQSHLRNSLITPLMRLITSLGNGGMFWILLTLVLLCIPRTRRAGVASAIALVFSLLFNNILLKNWVARTRPYEVVPGLTVIVARAVDYSFPSGHTGASVASAWAMFAYLKRPWRGLLMLLACLIAVSRLYVGIHYPTDVLGGFFTGFLAGWLGRLLEPRIRIRLTLLQNRKKK